MKEIDLEVEFGDVIENGGVSSVKTDHVRLGQIVTNLVANAIRFTASSSQRIITVRYDISFVPPDENTCAIPSDATVPLSTLEDTPVWLFVSVRDTGPGLAPREQAILFQRFSRMSGVWIRLIFRRR